MLSEQAKNELIDNISGIVLFDEPMRGHTSFDIGGYADALVIPKNKDDIIYILGAASRNNIPISIVGNGSNLLVSDNGIEGIVVKIAGCFNDVTIHGNKVVAGAGCLLPELSKLVANQGLSGLECIVGIPGTIGGAVMTNAGAHGASIGNVIAKVDVVDIHCEFFEIDQCNLKFGYRSSNLQNKNVIILGVEMKLERINVHEIKKRMFDYLQERRKRQPIGLRSAGSIFKNPKNNYAGKLIEDCGCKGMTIGDAQISERHANFIVNKGNATAQDVIQLMKKVQEIVFAIYGIELESEISIMNKR